MSGYIHLNAGNLPLISKQIEVPEYDRTRLKTGILHIGVGNFHRSHEAFYTDKVLKRNSMDWGICGVGLLEKDRKMINILEKQDGLFTLMVRGPENDPEIRVVGSIVEYLYAPSNPEAILQKMASPYLGIISLTITEGGYNYDADTGNFKYSEPLIQWDLKNPERPKTVFGYLTQALKRRRKLGLPGVTILSCDNIQKNGHICRTMLYEFVKIADASLLPWIDQQCTFPNSMVDRITPATSQEHIEELKTNYGIMDEWPVTCEPFIQWVIEDNFANRRPDWESVGVQLVHNVEPYERMKIHLLNASHSLLGFTGTLLGYQTIDETIRNPFVNSCLRKFIDREVTPVLGKIKGVNLDEYKKSLLQRFANPNIKDNLSRICAESSDKIPKFLLPTVYEQLSGGGSIKYSTFIIACWCRYLELADTPGWNYDIRDPMKDKLKYAAKATGQGEESFAFLEIRSIFGDLIEHHRFLETFASQLQDLRNSGIEETIRNLIVDKQ